MQLDFNDDQIKFIQLCDKYKDKLVALFQSQALEIKRGRAVLNFDQNGVLKNIEQYTISYERSRKCPPDLTRFCDGL